MEEINIGEKCADFRKMLGYTQQQVADEIGYTRNNITMFETGKNYNMLILMWYINKGMKL